MSSSSPPLRGWRQVRDEPSLLAALEEMRTGKIMPLRLMSLATLIEQQTPSPDMRLQSNQAGVSLLQAWLLSLPYVRDTTNAQEEEHATVERLTRRLMEVTTRPFASIVPDVGTGEGGRVPHEGMTILDIVADYAPHQARLGVWGLGILHVLMQHPDPPFVRVRYAARHARTESIRTLLVLWSDQLEMDLRRETPAPVTSRRRL